MIVAFFKKKSFWGTFKNYQIANGVKWSKMDLKWDKTSMVNFSVRKYHINAVFQFTLWVSIKRIYSSINKNIVLPLSLESGGVNLVNLPVFTIFSKKGQKLHGSQRS